MMMIMMLRALGCCQIIGHTAPWKKKKKKKKKTNQTNKP
jgi:hypothetical protein